MSKVFYDHLIVFEEIEAHLSSYTLHPEEKEKMHHMIDETIHYRVVTKILNHLPRHHHEKFLTLFHQAPWSKKILVFLKEQVADIEELIKAELENLKKELIDDFKAHKPEKDSLRLTKR